MKSQLIVPSLPLLALILGLCFTTSSTIAQHHRNRSTLPHRAEAEPSAYPASPNHPGRAKSGDNDKRPTIGGFFNRLLKRRSTAPQPAPQPPSPRGPSQEMPLQDTRNAADTPSTYPAPKPERPQTTPTYPAPLQPQAAQQPAENIPARTEGRWSDNLQRISPAPRQDAPRPDSYRSAPSDDIPYPATAAQQTLDPKPIPSNNNTQSPRPAAPSPRENKQPQQQEKSAAQQQNSEFQILTTPDEVSPSPPPPPVPPAPQEEKRQEAQAEAEQQPQQPQQPETNNYPTAEATGIPGRVVSPYLPRQILDITGMKKGEFGVDPRNGKVFLVP